MKENFRQAYLILAHNNWKSLERLLKFLDHPEIDIYLHIDKKSKDFNITRFKEALRFSQLSAVDRINIHWGTDDMAKAEMELFKKAYQNGPYRYYHLISGNDLPLKPLDKINEFFNSTEKNFIVADEEPEWEERLQVYMNVFEKFRLPLKLKNILNRYSNSLQFRIGLNRLKNLKRKYRKITKGHQWCDITEEAVKELLKNEKSIRDFCKFTNCCDEMYKQIVLSNSYLASTFSDIDIREIDWSEGGKHPRTFKSPDFHHLKDASDCGKIFARKFDESIDYDIIEKVYANLASPS